MNIFFSATTVSALRLAFDTYSSHHPLTAKNLRLALASGGAAW